MKYWCLLLVVLLVGASAGGENVPAKLEESVRAVVRLDSLLRSYSDGRSVLQSGTGAGVIISSEGEVITNYHVVGGSFRIKATLYSGEEVTARVIGMDPWTDLALIKLEAGATKFAFAPMHSSADLQQGDPVYAVGSPRMLRHTISKGIIASTRRFLADSMYFSDGQKTGPFTVWLQTDALVEGGSSGGPLLNESGEIIGIISRSYTAGSGFAVPSDQVSEIVTELRAKGRVSRGWLGILWSPSKPYLEAVDKNVVGVQGPLVTEIEDESPLSGRLSPGDIVTAINGTPLVGRYPEDMPEVRNFVSRLKAGSKVKLSLWKPGGAKAEVEAVVGEQAPASGKNDECLVWGMTVRGITRESKLDYGLRDADGVLVTGIQPAGPAEQAKLGAAFVIRSVDGKAVHDLADLMKAYNDSLPRGKALLTTTAGKFTMLHLIEFAIPAEFQPKKAEGAK